jgi:anti-sigma factor RsiW
VTQGKRRVATVENEILAAHLRGLIAPQPFDIASSQSHVVKPWFNGKTTIAPTTPDFTAEGFPLVGGRVDVIGRNPVPVMVYKRRQHTISVTVTAATDKDAAAPDAIDGTNVMNWTFGNLTYWAVSDLNPAELSSFADLYRKQLASGG